MATGISHLAAITPAATSGIPHKDSGLRVWSAEYSQQIGGCAIGLAVLTTVSTAHTASLWPQPTWQTQRHPIRIHSLLMSPPGCCCQYHCHYRPEIPQTNPPEEIAHEVDSEAEGFPWLCPGLSLREIGNF